MNQQNDFLGDWTLYVVATNRDIYLKECIDSFRKFYPPARAVLVDNSGDGRFKSFGKDLGFQVQVNNRILSVTENQNWILDNCPTKYFVFSADDIVFLRYGFLEESAELHKKGFELVSFGVSDPCAFSMATSKEPKIGRFNVRLGGKEKTDLDIRSRCETVYGFLPSIGGFWRKTPEAWESKYIAHRHDKPDVNRFLAERGVSQPNIRNEIRTETLSRLAGILRVRAATTIGVYLFKYKNIFFRRGLPTPIYAVRHHLPRPEWRNKRILSIGQMPGHYFWPKYLARFLDAPLDFEKIIIEKCEAYKPYLETKFSMREGYKIIADDVLNIDKFLMPKSVDLTVWYGGPEHLEKELAFVALGKIESLTKGLILIGAPKEFRPRGTDNSFRKIQNPYIVHLSNWKTHEFKSLGYESYIFRGRFPKTIAWKYNFL